MASKHLLADINCNDTVLTTLSSSLDVTGLTLLNINVDILAGTFVTAVVELEYSVDTDNWNSFSTPKTFTGAQEEVGYDIDVTDVNHLRLVLTTAEGGASTVRFELTASDEVGYWIDVSIDMDDLDARGQIMDVTDYNTVRATLSDLSSTIGSGELEVKRSNDGVVWSSFDTAIVLDTAGQEILIDVKAVRYIRAETKTVKGSALVGSLVAYATAIVVFGAIWIALSYASGWSTKLGANPLAYRQIGDVVHLRGIAQKSTWSLADAIHDGSALPPPIKEEQIPTIGAGSTPSLVEAVLLVVSISGDLTLFGVGDDSGTGGPVWLNGLSYATN